MALQKNKAGCHSRLSRPPLQFAIPLIGVQHDGHSPSRNIGYHWLIEIDPFLDVIVMLLKENSLNSYKYSCCVEQFCFLTGKDEYDQLAVNKHDR